MLRIITGGILILAGTVWVLQGFDVAFAPQSVMTGDTSWSWGGAAAAVVGIGLVWSGIRSRSTDD